MSILNHASSGSDAHDNVPAPQADKLLRVTGLTTEFRTRKGNIPAIEGISFEVAERETLCVVGESGSGKSVTALSIMRLIEDEGGFISAGEIHFAGRDITRLAQQQMESIRGAEIGMIFQEPMTALNPVFTIGRQISEVVLLHSDSTKKQALERAHEMLDLVGVASPRTRAGQYPHELSGGLRQRAMIAMALACNPKLLIADEPTTALDVTIQAQVLDLLLDLKDKVGMSMLLITHDMGVAAEMADRIVVMYAGRVVEEASVVDLFDDPRHPYTQGLLASIPSVGAGRQDRLHAIAGSTPGLRDMPSGCRFHTRCPYAIGACKESEPPLVNLVNRRGACWRLGDEELMSNKHNRNIWD